MSSATPKDQLSSTERRAAGVLAAVFGLRMLGLFLIMPVLAIYGQVYPDYTPLMIGLAIGAYGLTQALLQIPFGLWSDRWGRRPVIVTGLLIFIAGSAVAAMADTLAGVIVGRALQGAGAIAAAILALAADVSRDSQRAKIMAIIGMCIGMSFALALVIGPVLAEQVGMAGLFWFTALAAGFGLVLFWFAVPEVTARAAPGDILPLRGELQQLLSHPQLLRLNGGVFVLHAILTSFFVVVPLQLVASGLPANQHAWLYLPVLLVSFMLMVPLLIRAERKRAQPFYFRLAIVLLISAVIVVLFSGASWWYLVVAILLFFTGFNFLEANLPAALTRFAPAGRKGGASGIYSTWQFLGAFVGGAGGGFVQQQFGSFGVGIFCLALLLCWLVLTWGMQAPPQWQNITVALPSQVNADEFADQLSALTGVEEVRIVPSEQIVYLKVHKSDYNEHDTEALLASVSK